MQAQLSIADAAAECRQTLIACQSLKQLMQNEWAENRLADFNLWASSTGALARPRASLDARLALSPDTRDVVAKLLRMLNIMVGQCLTLAQQDTEAQIVNNEHNQLVEPQVCRESLSPAIHAKSIRSLSSNESEDESDSSTTSTSSTGTPLTEATESVNSLLEQLGRIAVAVRKSGTHSRGQKADARFKAEEHQELRMHLSTVLLSRGRLSKNHSYAGDTLDLAGLNAIQLRLIDCNLKRRNRFIYAQTHARGLDDDSWRRDPSEGRTPRLSQSHLGSSKAETPGSGHPLSESKDGLHEHPGPAGTSASGATDVDTQYKKAIAPQGAPTELSTTVNKLVYPKPPRHNEDAHLFRCPCCCIAYPVDMADSKNQTRWKKHLAEDICPYTCVLPKCPQPLTLFATREAWKEHLHEEHPKNVYWVCFACPDAVRFDQAEELHSHILQDHRSIESELQIQTLKSAGERTAPQELTCCPLCDNPQTQEASVDKLALTNHIAEHVHEFSLRSLPWPRDNETASETRIEQSAVKVAQWLGIEEELSAVAQSPSAKQIEKVAEAHYFDDNAYFAESLAGTRSTRPSCSSERSLQDLAGLPELTFEDSQVVSGPHTVAAQPDHNGPIQYLLEKIALESRPSCDITQAPVSLGAPSETFVPRSTIEKYLRDNQCFHTNKILKAVYQPELSPLTGEEVADNCARILCILASLSKACFIEHFVTNELWDNRLPFDSAAPPDYFPEDTKDKRFYEKFKAEQWRFCAPELSPCSGRRFRDRYILPITALSKVGHEGTANVYKAEVHTDYDKLVNPCAPAHMYAIKTFRKRNAEANYEAEFRALKKITDLGRKPTPGMIAFYGSFEYRGSFNILLEYADGGTLEDVFQSEARPRNAQDILDFWSNMFEPIKAVFAIHDKRLERDGTEVRMWQGWHQDLKPTNILVVRSASGSPFAYTYRITDFGLCRFKTIMEGEEEASDLDMFGTITYGAPESDALSSYSEPRRHLVRRKVDVWSLGCIYSEAAVWLVKGAQGLANYRNDRQAATKRLSNFRGGKCFHDGHKLLDVVKRRHDSLRNDMDLNDYVTGHVLELMLAEMLHEKPDVRPSAEQLLERAERIRSRAEYTMRDLTLPVSYSTRLRASATSRDPIQRSDALLPWDLELQSLPQSEIPLRTRAPPPSPTIRKHGEDVIAREQAQAAMEDLRLAEGYDERVNVFDDEDYTMDFRTAGLRRLESKRAQRHSGEANRHERRREFYSDYDTTPKRQRRKERPPHLDLSLAIQWKNDKKATTFSGGPQKKTPLEYGHFRAWLNDRDHIFLVDDSSSMQQYWQHVKTVVDILAYLVKEGDPDGSELYFTKSAKSVQSRMSSDLVNLVTKHSPLGKTDISVRLGKILQDKQQALYDQNAPAGSSVPCKSARPVTIYVLTDGVWEDGKDAKTPITNMIHALKKLRYDRKQVGIQFISFGQNKAGLARLQELDDFGKLPVIGKDIVDTEGSQGNVWKMLLGSIDKTFDEGDEDEDEVDGEDED